MVAGGLVVVAIIMLCVHTCCGKYKTPKINKVEEVRMFMFSDTTVFCGPDSPCFSVVLEDSSEVIRLRLCGHSRKLQRTISV